MVASPDVETRAVPETLIVDNGKEFVNTNMMSLSKDISILYRQASPRAPDQKAFVERVFHTFNQQFFHALPGTTKSSPAHRGDYNSGAEAAINIFDLRRLFGQYLSEVYHYGKHSTLECSPIEKWRELGRQVPPRTLTEARKLALALIESNADLRCVWTAGKLNDTNLVIDHCFPWSRWRNNDLWNLLPATEKANNSKSDKLPSAPLMESSKPAITRWWQEGYLQSPLSERFWVQAKAALPFSEQLSDVDELFNAMCLQRAVLRKNQRLEEWR
ncbi:HNH endonuclease domain-containing protein [Limnobacter sp.]|uniref:HNH endonuclease domain-containing protein n=1 Tax=Limnobacter sp. TaxID=2003368 RepID=UPI0027B99B8B|nr:HNH endonuclease domain-containing protein [Limnobacter sp.]